MAAANEFDAMNAFKTPAPRTGAPLRKIADPNDEPNPANPGGVSNNQLNATSAARGPSFVAAAPVAPAVAPPVAPRAPAPVRTLTAPAAPPAPAPGNTNVTPQLPAGFDPNADYSAQDAAIKKDAEQRKDPLNVRAEWVSKLPVASTWDTSPSGIAGSQSQWDANYANYVAAYNDRVTKIRQMGQQGVGGINPTEALAGAEARLNESLTRLGGRPGGGAAPAAGAGPGGAPGAAGTNPTQLQNTPVIDPVTGLPVAGYAPGGSVPGAPGAGTPDPTAPAPIVADYSRYDQAAQDLQTSRDIFTKELDRLAGVDPFGNQANLQKATDRSIAQASGTAAMVRGGSAALAGANRVAQGTQQQLQARGIQDMAQQRITDQNSAGSQRLAAAGGIADLAKAGADNEVDLGNQAVAVGTANLDAAMKRYGITANIGQAERESLRGLGIEMAKIDMQRYMTDTDYRKNVDDNVIAKYVSDNQLSGVVQQIQAQENISTGEAVMGLIGAGSGIAQEYLSGGVKSDQRLKYDVRDPDVRDLEDFLGKTKGKLYQYRFPMKAGQRSGLNFGPMAQDLQKSKIGATLVRETPEGLEVDTGRLALADHSALASLAADVKRLKARLAKRGSK